MKYHYLKDISRGFKSGINYGLFYKNEIVGVIIFTGFPVPELVKGMFNLERTQQEGMFELSRLVIHPSIQEEEHNITSWFVARTIKMLRKETPVRALLSYADSKYHSGCIYAATNFKYYGLSAKKCDFYFWINNSYKKHSRGKVKGKKGKWFPRSQKHRFLLLFDKTLNIKWTEQKWQAQEIKLLK